MTPHNVAAVIPARGQSRRLPRKNLRPLAGKPLFLWSVDCARAAGIENIVVSTEDHEIASLAESNKCSVHLRPDALAGDHVSATEVVLDVVANRGESDTRWVVLLPTWPFRLPEHIKEILSYSPTHRPVNRLTTISRLVAAAQGRLLLSASEWVPATYEAFITDSYISVLLGSSVSPATDFPIQIHRNEAQFLDIDTPADWAKAQWFAIDEKRWRISNE